MTHRHTRVRVGADGNAVVPVGVDEAGHEVDVVVTPARRELTQQEYQAVIDQTTGSIDDDTFVRPPQWPNRDRECLE